MTAVVDSTIADSLNLDNATLTCGLNGGGIILCTCKHPAPGTNQLSLTVTMNSSDPDRPESGAYKIAAYNLAQSSDANKFYTGRPIPFTLSIDDFSYTFYVKMGPVIELYGNTPNSSDPSHTDGSILKPIANNKCISQTRGHEWYMGSDNAIHMTSNGNVNNDTEQGHTWNVTWSFNGTNLTAASSPDTGYNREFAYPNDASPCIKIQHPASWTETSGSNHPSDPGAWLISILDTTDPATG